MSTIMKTILAGVLLMLAPAAMAAPGPDTPADDVLFDCHWSEQIDPNRTLSPVPGVENIPHVCKPDQVDNPPEITVPPPPDRIDPEDILQQLPTNQTPLPGLNETPALPGPNGTPGLPGLNQTPSPPGLNQTPSPPGLNQTPSPPELPGLDETPDPCELAGGVPDQAPDQLPDVCGQLANVTEQLPEPPSPGSPPAPP